MQTALTHPTIETKRLSLRPVELRDLEAYRAFYAASDLDVGKYRSGRSDEEINQIHTNDIRHWQYHGFGMWILRRKDKNPVIGGAGLVNAKGWPVELTWWLMPAARAQGFATEASQAIIRFACETLGWSHVETFMRDGNIAAHKLAKRLGGKKSGRNVFPDGVARDIYHLSPEAKV
ncbi:MAG: GNAT family N-acetyltransferase [Pseudomonadota bacterium]